MTDQGARFGFGKNWEKFIKNNFSDERVEIAGRHILDFLDMDNLQGKYFLDIGCGSGLHSLAALRAGAERICSFDYDPYAVKTAMKLRELAGNPARWQVMQGSILDDDFVKKIEPADIVYSWGVLHHTGDMWKAMDNAARLAKGDSLLYIALYDHDMHVDPPAEFWLEIKQRYNRSWWPRKRRMELWYIWNFLCYRKWSEVPNLVRRFANYKQSRGMALYTDVVDWLGGWPMEFARRADVAAWAERTGLEMPVMKTGEANTEYLFQRGSGLAGRWQAGDAEAAVSGADDGGGSPAPARRTLAEGVAPRGMMIIHQFRPVAAGAELQAERLAKKLVEIGHPMSVLTQLRTANTPTEEVMSGVTVHRVPFSLAYWVRRSGVIGTFRYLVNNRHSYDVLHVHQAFGHAVVAVVASRLLRKRCIIKVACAGEYGDMSVFSRFEDFDRALKILHHADAVVAISAEVERELLERGFSPERIVRIPNGVDTDYFKRTAPPPPREPVRFALVGRRHPQKGVDVALQAAKLLKDGGLGGRFEIELYGADYPEFNYFEMARQLGVRDVVNFLPFQSDMVGVLQGVHCLILPSRGEGLSNALLEAMSMELPVIATLVSGTVDVVTDGEDGILIPPESPEALAKAMSAIIRYPELARVLGKNARSKVEHSFSLDFVAGRYSELYQTLFER